MERVNEATRAISSTRLLLEQAIHAHRADQAGDQGEYEYRLAKLERELRLLKGRTVAPQGSLAARQRDFVGRSRDGRIS